MSGSARQVADRLTVPELLERCRQRPPDEAAWTEFVRRYDQSIRMNVSKTYRLRASQESERRPQFPDDLVEDLVQAVYMRLVQEGNRALKHFEGSRENSIYNYLGIIAMNVVRDHFREAKAIKRPKVTFSLDELLEVAGEGGALKNAISTIDGRVHSGSRNEIGIEEIEAALKKSVSHKHSDRDILIFKLRYYEGLTLEEIRKALGLEISAIGIGSILNRIIIKIKDRLTRGRKN